MESSQALEHNHVRGRTGSKKKKKREIKMKEKKKIRLSISPCHSLTSVRGDGHSYM
jgi:hypothetical protein